MKLTHQFMVRAALVLTAAGTIGAFGACKSDSPAGPPPPPPPPPPPTILAPTGLTATAASGTRIDLAWTDNATNETGYRVERCSGAACSTFAQIGVNTEANIMAFADTFGIAAATSYSYRVRAFNATDSSTFSTTATIVTGSPPPAGQVLIGAGEITTCSSLGTSQTATLIQNQITADPTTIVFTAGNNVATATAGAGNYTTCFDPTWGRFKSNMHAALGDMDFRSTSGSAPYDYFGAAIGSSKGYYSFDVGSWHIIVLNTTAEGAGKCAWSQDPISRTNCASSEAPELDWLQLDLTANTKPCLLAISWERRLYTSTSGSLGRNSDMNAAAEMMRAAGLDVLISAKDQQYERFPKLNVDGVADPAGFAQFIVGTGGRSLAAMHTPATGNPVAAQFGGRVDAQNKPIPDSWGVIKFTLNANSYDWTWVGTNPSDFSDSGTQACN